MNRKTLFCFLTALIMILFLPAVVERIVVGILTMFKFLIGNHRKYIQTVILRRLSKQ